jgi:signal transduction histidine kinase
MNDKVNILLVDDQPARLLSYEAILGQLGQNLVLANSGQEALQKLMKDDFAVVLLDVSMPEMDGFETASLIHDHPRFEKTPIIFVTGVNITEFDRLKGYRLGAVDYVYVPVVPEILRSKVAALVELHCKRLELQQLNQSLERANQRLALAHSTLQAEKNRELEELNRTLQNANAQLEATNRILASEVEERRRVEAALTEADRHKNEFIAILAHELRNPLAPINNAVQIVRNRQVDDAQIAWAHDIIERQTLHLARLVDDLLDVARITRGTINLRRDPVEVATFVSRALETSGPLIVERRHDLTVDLPPERLFVEGDLTRLTQIVGNLLNNAAKYTDFGGKITIAARARDGHVEIRVRDNGIGISADKQPGIFTLFGQVDRTLSHSHGGLGIGLALVRKLVDLHGGAIDVASAGLEQGSEFTVRLPLVVNRAQLEPGAVIHGDAENAQPKYCILIADDNYDALATLDVLLRQEGHSVHAARDGEQAFALACACRPDVALLDIGMPRLDGYLLARKMREQEWGKDTLLIAVTGWGQAEDRRRSVEVGFDAHMVKPLDFGELRKLLDRVPVRAGDQGTRRLEITR